MILTVANQKGGVGKTTTTFNLGFALATKGDSVLMVDLDPQASLTLACGIENSAGRSISEVVGSHQQGTLGLDDVIVELGDNIHLAPSDILLASHEAGLWQRWNREHILALAIEPILDNYDHVIIDSPPNLGLLTVNALAASDRTLIPTIPDYLSLRGLVLFLETAHRIREQLNRELEILGVLLNFFDQRLLHTRDVVAAMERQGIPVLPFQVRRSVRLAEASLAHEPIIRYDPRNAASATYLDLAEVVRNA